LNDANNVACRNKKKPQAFSQPWGFYKKKRFAYVIFAAQKKETLIGTDKTTVLAFF